MVSDDEFAEFVAARTPALFRSAWLMCGQQHAAEDLVQETFAKLFVSWGRRRIDNPAAYAHTTLVRTFISARRRRSAHEHQLVVVPERGEAAADVPLRVDLLTALSQLTPTDRAVLVLRYLDDLDVADTAALLGVSDAAVRSRSMRALARVREHLGDPTDFLGGVR